MRGDPALALHQLVLFGRANTCSILEVPSHLRPPRTFVGFPSDLDFLRNVEWEYLYDPERSCVGVTMGSGPGSYGLDPVHLPSSQLPFPRLGL